jgi:hypothetical protein
MLHSSSLQIFVYPFVYILVQRIATMRPFFVLNNRAWTTNGKIAFIGQLR